MKYKYIDNTEDGLPRMIQDLLEKALTYGGVATENEVVIDDYDLGRVYLTISGVDYTLRIWNEHETTKSVIINWTLYSREQATGLASSESRFSKAKYPNENEPVKKVKRMDYIVCLLKPECRENGMMGKHKNWKDDDEIGTVDEKQYTEVYKGSINVPGKYAHEQTLDEIFKLLNIDKPADYTHPSLSVGDVVVLRDFTYYYDGTSWKHCIWHEIDDDVNVMAERLRKEIEHEKADVLSVYFRPDVDGVGIRAIGWNEYRVKDHEDVVSTMLADIEKHGVSHFRFNGIGTGFRMRDGVKVTDIDLYSNDWKLDLMQFNAEEEERKNIERLRKEGLIK